MARFELFARTEIGCARERNEDAFVVVDLAGGHTGLHPEQRVHDLVAPGSVVAVCDGMGGAAAGDVASGMAAEAITEACRGASGARTGAELEAVLLRAVRAANQRILAFSASHPERYGMGTTVTAAALFGARLVVVHVGDSRAYLKRGRTLRQLTTDHSVVGQMIASGQLTPEQARTFDQRNVLLQAVGVQPQVKVDVVEVDVMAGDVLLLCSDGLTGPVEDPALLDILLKHADPMRACRALTEAACALGGPDNITVAIARYLGEGLAVPDARSRVEPTTRTLLL